MNIARVTEVPHSAKVLQTLAVVRGFLGDAELGALEQLMLHELADPLQLHITGVHAGIAQTYFPAPAGATTMLQLQPLDTPQQLQVLVDVASN